MFADLFWVSALSLFAGLCAWEALSRLAVLPPFLFPAPTVILLAAAKGAASGAMLPHLLATLRHLFLGFSAGCVAAVPLAFLCARWRVFDRILDPWINATLPLPLIALLPFFMMLFGVGERLCAILPAIGAFYSVFISARAGIRKTDASLVDAARNLGAGDLAVFKKVILPSALPYILVGMHLGLLQALRLVITVEAMLAMKGIGYMLWMNGEWLRVELYYAYVFLLAVVGIGIVLAFKTAIHFLAPWAETQVSEQTGA